MQVFIPLFADADIFKFIVAAVFIVITVLNKLLSGGKEAKADKKPVVPKPRDVPPVPNVRRAQQDEIDEFLRRAADNLKPKRQTARPTPPKAPPPPQKQAPPRRLVEMAQEIQPLQSVERESVAAHVQKHLSTAQFETRASTLIDEDLTAADRQREQHRKEVFGHRVGTLTDTSVFEVEPTEQSANIVTQTAAAGLPLASLLGSPDSLRRAIVLNEILTRPEQRWSTEPSSYT
jgi:hypothetical protein